MEGTLEELARSSSFGASGAHDFQGSWLFRNGSGVWAWKSSGDSSDKILIQSCLSMMRF